MAATAVSRSCSPPSQLRQKFTVKDIDGDGDGEANSGTRTVTEKREVGLDAFPFP